MEEQDVAYFVEQLGLEKEVVEAAIKEGTLSQRIKDATKDQVVYKTPDDFEAFKTNFKTEVETKYISDLEEKAKKGDIPQILYAPIKGAALQQAERELAKKHGVDEYDNLDDLVGKLIKTSANGNVNEELQRQLDELKTRNQQLADEKEEALSTVEKDYKNKFLTKFKEDMVKNVPHDFSSVNKDELTTYQERTRKVLTNVFDADYTLDYDENGREVVKKDGDIIKNQNTYEPVPVLDVFTSLAKEIGQKLKSPDSGGQGGSSSGKTTGSYATVEEFEADMASKGIKNNDPKYIEAYAASGLGNRK
jgi:hypothetical protein